MVKAFVIRPGTDGEVIEMESDVTAMQAMVGGWLEMLRPTKGIQAFTGWHAWCDEEGAMRAAEGNMMATLLAHALGWPGGQVLVGTVVFVGGEEVDRDVPQFVMDMRDEVRASLGGGGEPQDD